MLRLLTHSIFKLFGMKERVHKAYATAIYRCKAMAKIVKKDIYTNNQDKVSKTSTTEGLEEMFKRNTHKNEMKDVHVMKSPQLEVVTDAI